MTSKHIPTWRTRAMPTGPHFSSDTIVPFMQAEITDLRARIAELEAKAADWTPSEAAVRDQALEEAAVLFPQEFTEYFGRDLQDAIRALQSPAAVRAKEPT